ncbi:MAG: sulfatase [Pseudarcicella sp.]|nr:sulfatase [Pseudarcicella sp.]
MKIKYFFQIAFITLGCSVAPKTSEFKISDNAKPNVIVIFTDDQGYQDLGCYGASKIKTPNIDKMASEGIRLTDFYVSTSICSPSRAALLTGRSAALNGVGNVFMPDNKGMATEEITIAEMLKTVGYKTACFGKWHLGDLDGHLPTDQGFDEYFGIPYSNDMYISPSQTFSENVLFRDGYTLAKAQEDQKFVAENKKDNNKLVEKGLRVKSPLFEKKKIIEYPCNQSTLTTRYFERAIDFIKHSENQPFFLYITPSMPHVPLYANEKFAGKSERGLYGDVIEEIDWQVGNLIEYLKKAGLDQNTLIVFSSDNGPWLSYKEEAGSALPLRDGKFSSYEGGMRVPCIMRWPGVIPQGNVSSQILSTLDFLPTIAAITKAQPPKVQLSGTNIISHLKNPKIELERNIFFYEKQKEIWGVRKGNWKLLPHGGSRTSKVGDTPELYDLKQDISEKVNLANKYPEIVKELQEEIVRYKN